MLYTYIVAQAYRILFLLTFNRKEYNIKRYIKAANERKYKFSELSDSAKDAALSNDAICELLQQNYQSSFAEDYASLKYSLDSVEFTLTQDDYNYDILTGYLNADLDIELTPRGEDIFTIEGLDSDYHVDIPDVQSNGLFIGETFASTWKTQFKRMQKQVEQFNDDMDSFRSSNSDADDILYYADSSSTEYVKLEAKLAGLQTPYEHCAKVAMQAAVDDFVVDYEYSLSKDNPYVAQFIDEQGFEFDANGNSAY